MYVHIAGREYWQDAPLRAESRGRPTAAYPCEDKEKIASGQCKLSVSSAGLKVGGYDLDHVCNYAPALRQLRLLIGHAAHRAVDSFSHALDLPHEISKALGLE